MSDDDVLLELGFTAEIIYWRGPSPFFYAPVPEPHVEALKRAVRAATYGWGVAPVEAKANEIAFTTALFPKDGTYLLPLKAAVRLQANLTAGDVARFDIIVRPPKR